MNSKEKYILLCDKESSIPVFQTYWWLDAAVGEKEWDVVLVENDGNVIGAFPYVCISKYGIACITMPRFVTMMGIWIKYPIGQKYSDRLHYEQSISSQLIAQLPAVDYFQQSFHYHYTNWLPFYWKGYSQTTRYTYVLPIENQNVEEVFRNFAHSKRKNLLRSERQLTVKENLPLEEFYQLHKLSLALENKKIDYPLSLLRNLYEAAIKNNGGKIIYAVDDQNNIHAALFTVWNKESSFNLIHPIHPNFKQFGASTLLTKQMIAFLSDKTKTFDFEGSMQENIAESFRRFGAIQKPYFVIKKATTIKGKIYSLLKYFKD